MGARSQQRSQVRRAAQHVQLVLRLRERIRRVQELSPDHVDGRPNVRLASAPWSSVAPAATARTTP